MRNRFTHLIRLMLSTHKRIYITLSVLVLFLLSTFIFFYQQHSSREKSIEDTGQNQPSEQMESDNETKPLVKEKTKGKGNMTQSKEDVTASTDPVTSPSTQKKQNTLPKDNYALVYPQSDSTIQLNISSGSNHNFLTFTDFGGKSTSYTFWVQPVKTKNYMPPFFNSNILEMYEAHSGYGNPAFIYSPNEGDVFKVSVCGKTSGECNVFSNTVKLTIALDSSGHVSTPTKFMYSHQ